MWSKFFLIIIICCNWVFFSNAQNVDLVSPSNNIITKDTSIVFLWNKHQEASYYIINISTSPLFSSLVVEDSTSNLSFYAPNLNSNQIYFWRVRCKKTIDYSDWSYRKFTIFNPKDISSIALWLDADSGITQTGGRISQWDDQSGQNNHVYQANPSRYPILINNDDSIADHSSVYFNGADYYMTGNPISDINNTSLTIFSINSGEAISNAENSGIFTINDYSNGLWFERRTFGSPALMFANNGIYFDSGANSLEQDGFNYKICTANKTFNNSVKLFINGQLNSIHTNSTITGPFTNGNFNIGYAYTFYKGRISEIIIFKESLNDSLQNLVYNYLQDKYAPPVNLGPDKTIDHELCPIILSVGNYFETCLWSNGSSEKSIITTENGLYWVEATDIFGRTSKDSIIINRPFLDFPDLGLCITDTIKANTNLSNAYGFLWNDASTDSLLEISAAGTYWVEITDSTALHCSLRDSFIVVVDSFPINTSIGNDRSLCQGDVLELIDGGLSAVDYLWNNGDTTESIVVNTAGEYSLSVTNINGCLAFDTVNIDIAGLRPSIGFDFNKVCNGSPVAFADTSEVIAPDGPNSWLWIFGDGDSAMVQNPQHVFPSAGDFPVLLRLTTDSGCKADTLVSVHVYRNPSAYFTPVQGCSGQNILFFDESSSNEGFLNGYQWAFDDPSSGSLNSSMIQNPYHMFANAGDYSVQMIVQTNIGCYDTIIRPVHIKNSPQASFSYTSACEGNRVFFNDVTNVPVYEKIINTIWYFDDGNTSTYSSTSNQYENSGIYNVMLIVQSLNGCYDTVVQAVTVHPVPLANFNWENPCYNQTVEFNDNSSILFDSIVEYSWIYAELDHGSNNPSYFSFPDTGDYEVVLTVTSDFGCSDSVHKIVKVYPIPTALFSVNPEYGIPPIEVQLYNQSTGGSSNYWQFGDGSVSSAVNPSHTYYGTDIYDIWLTVTNEYGCADSTSQVVYVIPGLLDLRIDDFAVEDSLGEYQLTIDMTNQGTRNIREIVFEADVIGNIPVREHWDGLLLPGQNLRYRFQSSFLSQGGSTHQYLCVNAFAENTAEADATPENNVECYSLVDEFNIIEIYPNPADESTVVSFYMPEDGNVDYTLTSSDGKLIEIGKADELEAGVNKIFLATLHLAAGTYTMQLNYLDNKVSTIILVGHN